MWAHREEVCLLMGKTLPYAAVDVLYIRVLKGSFNQVQGDPVNSDI